MRVSPSIMALPVAMAPAEVWYIGNGEYSTSFSVNWGRGKKMAKVVHFWATANEKESKTNE